MFLQALCPLRRYERTSALFLISQVNLIKIFKEISKPRDLWQGNPLTAFQ